MRLIRSQLDLETRVQIMGVLNVTPDSFSDGGEYIDPEAAVARALEIEAEGADLLDVGGESTRPGSQSVDVEEELCRIIPVLERLSGRLRIPISIDTTKYEVACAALSAGAEMINDTSGLRFEPRLADLAAETGAALVLMHSRGTPETMQKLPPVDDIFAEVIGGLRLAVEEAERRGVRREQLIVDPGLGFGKTAEQNLALIGRLDLLIEALALPILLGASRKSFIKRTLDRKMTGTTTVHRDEASERLIGTLVSTLIGIERGARIIRVHDVGATVVAARMAEAIREAASDKP
jgi:dihydropteroate synthase